MTSGKCPLCGRRRAGRACPALGHRICAVCCGTKRQAEIDCPPDCGYLAASQAHPPAVVQRQRERDVLFLLPMMHELSGPQQELALLLQTLLRRDRAETPGLVDSDVEHAARSLAETCETASRGIIYEHAAGYAAAERLKEETPAGFLESAPDLAVEVVSPGDSTTAVRDKVRDWLEAGTRLVWVACPRTRSVVVHRPGRPAEALRDDDHLQGGSVLPDFAVPVRDLFT